MYHEFGAVDSIMKKFYAGKLISNELPVFPDPTDFHKTIKTRVEGYFKSKGKDPKVSTITDKKAKKKEACPIFERVSDMNKYFVLTLFTCFSRPL